MGFLEVQMQGLLLGVYTEKSQDDNETKCKRDIAAFTNTFQDVDEKTNGKLSEILKSTGPFHKSRSKLLWTALLKSDNFKFDCVSVVDLKNKDPEDDLIEAINQKAENVRCAIADGILTLEQCCTVVDIHLDSCESPQSVAEAAYLTLYSYDELKQKYFQKRKINLHLYETPSTNDEEKKSYQTGVILAESQNFARYLMDAPANCMTPTIFASKVEEKFCGSKVKVIIRDKKWAESMKMGSYLSVSRGSEEEPKFVELHYDGLPGVDKHVAFVGKGITFDSGGISLKPALNMDKMRADMGGAATVTAIILAARDLDLKINLKGFLPLCENLPGGKANKPGDVVWAMNGKTIQIDNTDYEGRLVLADGLCYAQQFKPCAIIDIATLTVAMKISLGAGAAGVISNDDELWDILNEAGYITGDRVWRMPLYKLYSSYVTPSNLADVNNLGIPNKGAGHSLGGAFLKEFIEPNIKWMHLDIYGVMECDRAMPYMISGMSGRPTRTLVHFLQDLAQKFS